MLKSSSPTLQKEMIMPDFLAPNMRLARKKKAYLGLWYLSAEAFEAVLEAAKKEYKKYDESAIGHGLTWPEFIVVMAGRLGHISLDLQIALMLDCLDSVGSVGGMTRASWNKDHYLTWDGWKKLK